MFPLFLLASLLQPLQEPAPNQFEILQHVKLNVKAQLALSSNYTCVQTIERTYYSLRHACVPNANHGKPKEFMRDRIRLDVAVSEGREIYSFHGENRFTSSRINEVIPNGPTTSGQFVGFLRNIFLTPGVQFTFRGASQFDGTPIYTFSYVVQLLRSTYFLQGATQGSIIPYHGEFSVDAASFELVSLTITADEIPLTSGMCSAQTDVKYQMANISGHSALLPASYVLKIESTPGMYTVNSNQYMECREFRGESTLHFTVIDSSAPTDKPRAVDVELPAGLNLEATLDGPIDDENSFIGDPVQATLAEPVSIPTKKQVIPKGARLHGIISELERHSEGANCWLFAVRFDRIESGQGSYITKAVPLPAAYRLGIPRFAPDRLVASAEAEAARRGFWLMDGTHFKLPKHFTRYWRTEPIRNAAGSETESTTR
jgi:hypothetical protein